MNQTSHTPLHHDVKMERPTPTNTVAATRHRLYRVGIPKPLTKNAPRNAPHARARTLHVHAGGRAGGRARGTYHLLRRGQDNTDALSGDDEMVVVARVVLLVAGSANKPDEEGASSVSAAGGKEGESGSSSSIEHGDIMQALSGAHLREVGIAIKEARPGWQEAHVQVCLWMCVCVCVCVCSLRCHR